MAGTAVSELIFFITALMVSSAVALVLVEVIDQYADNIRDEASMLNGEVRSRLSIINDPSNVPYDPVSDNLTFYLKNTGTGDLSTADIAVSANGTALSGANISVELLGGGLRWSPGSTVEVIFKVPDLGPGRDTYGWASTSGIDGSGGSRGSAQDTIVFRTREV